MTTTHLTPDLVSGSLFDNLGLITIEELAGALRRSPKTIRNWVARREVPFVMIKNRVMFRKASIEAWIERLEKKEFNTWR